MSEESRNAIASALARYYTQVEITFVNNLADLEDLVARKPDLVFLGMKFTSMNASLGLFDPHRIWLGQYLDEHDIPYTGSSSEAHKLELNKPLAKQRVLDAGLTTSAYSVFKQGHSPAVLHPQLTYPLFVKPTDRGGGLGIDSESVVHNLAALQSKVTSIIVGLQSDSLVENYLPGREFSVAILENEFSDGYLTMPIELVAPNNHGARLLTAGVKSANAERALTITDKTLKAQVCTLAINVFQALGACSYGRIDIRLDESGTPHFLEANLLPSLISGYGSFPKACELNEGIGYEAMLLTIVRLALTRQPSIHEDALTPV